MSQTEAATVRSSIEDVWYLKQIKFNGKKARIITQNFNGPCSFIAICNILILRGNIEVLPRTRRTVSYEFLSQLVADYLLKTSPNVDMSAALSVMPVTQKGMDLNPLFTSSTAFRPSESIGSGGGELKLFEYAGIPLVHGWLVDPESPDAEVFKRIKDYDTAVELIAEVDHLTNGKFVLSENEAPASPTSPIRNWTEDEMRKVEDAIVIRRFLDTTQSQLTYHGLFHLASSLPPNSLCALFRNSHLSVLYKHTPSTPEPPPQLVIASSSNTTPSETLAPAPDAEPSSSTAQSTSPAVEGVYDPPAPGPTESNSNDDSALYSLVTDQVFLYEPYVVWERFEDVDGGWSTFVDSDFVRSSPAGGDFAGQTAEEALRAAEAEAHPQPVFDSNDLALAQQLQAEEEHLARQQHAAYLREEERRRLAAMQQPPPPVKKAKKKGDCIVM